MTTPGHLDYLSFFQTYLLTEKRLSRNSVSAYLTDAEQLQKHLAQKYAITLPQATGAQLKAYIRLLHNAKSQPRTIARKVSAFKVLYAFLAERYGAINVAEVLIIPKIEKTLPTYLTHDEIQALIKAAMQDETPRGRRNLMMLQLLYATGLRITELVTLRIENIHFDTGFVSVLGKGGRQREIPLPMPICEALGAYVRTILSGLLADTGITINGKTLIFPTVRGRKITAITRQAFWCILKGILVISGITKNVSPHTLRHSLATHLLQAGADIRSLQLWLGHEQMSTVEIYTHLDKSMVRKAYDHKHPRA
ncbi:MAG: integrase/recombinase XerD [Candidatus Dependentiae bacterium]|nr:integrase/recombinase XerD [Candidatus Dependentiae bacterium]